MSSGKKMCDNSSDFDLTIELSTILRKPLDVLSYSEAQLVTFFLEPLTLRMWCDLHNKHVEQFGRSSPDHISASHILYHAHMAFNGPFISTDAHFSSIRSIFNALLNKIQAGFIPELGCKPSHVECRLESSSHYEKHSLVVPSPNIASSPSSSSQVVERVAMDDSEYLVICSNLFTSIDSLSLPTLQLCLRVINDQTLSQKSATYVRLMKDDHVSMSFRSETGHCDYSRNLASVLRFAHSILYVDDGGSNRLARERSMKRLTAMFSARLEVLKDAEMKLELNGNVGSSPSPAPAPSVPPAVPSTVASSSSSTNRIIDVKATQLSFTIVAKEGKLPELKDVFRVDKEKKPVSSIGIIGSDSDTRNSIAINLSNAWVKSQAIEFSELEKDVRVNRLLWTNSVKEMVAFYNRCLAEFGSSTVPEKPRCLILEANDLNFGKDLNYGYDYVRKLVLSAAKLNLLVIVVLPSTTVFLHSRPHWFQSFDLTYILDSNAASVLQYLKNVSPATLVNSIKYPEAGLNAFYAKNRSPTKCIVVSSIWSSAHLVLRTNTRISKFELSTSKVPLTGATSAAASALPVTAVPSSTDSSPDTVTPPVVSAHPTSSVKKSDKLPKLKHPFFPDGRNPEIRSIVLNGSDYSTRKMAGLDLAHAWVHSQVTGKDSEGDIRKDRLTRTSSVTVLQSLWEQYCAEFKEGTVPKKSRCLVIQTTAEFEKNFEIGYGLIHNLVLSPSNSNLLVIVIPHETISMSNRPRWFQKFDLTYMLQSSTDLVTEYLSCISGNSMHCSHSLRSVLDLDAYFAKKRGPLKCIVVSSVPGSCPVVMRTDTSVIKFKSSLPFMPLSSRQ
jgi:hypothetical protein